MSNSSYLDSLRFATRQINGYGELFVFLTGSLGEIMNIIVFTSLKTFRETTCALYLIITSIANIGLLVAILLRIVYDGFSIDLSYTPLLCKFRYLLTQYFGCVSLTSMCMATIDQFLSTTIYKRSNNLRFARRFIGFICIFWFLPDIFIFVYYDSYLNSCILTNAAFAQYYTYFNSLILLSLLPLTIMSIFSTLAFFKIRTIHSRQINIVRLRRDRQLTGMTLFHVLFIIITSIPFIIVFMYTLIKNTRDPIQLTYIQLVSAITLVFYYISYSCSFYIYFCVSKRFRKQVAYVLINIHRNRHRRRANNNQVVPYPMVTLNGHHRIPSPNDIALY